MVKGIEILVLANTVTTIVWNERKEWLTMVVVVVAIPVGKREEKRKMKGWLDPNESHAKMANSQTYPSDCKSQNMTYHHSISHIRIKLMEANKRTNRAHFFMSFVNHWK